MALELTVSASVIVIAAFPEVPNPNPKPVLLNCAYGVTLAAVELLDRNAKKLYLAPVSPLKVTVMLEGLVPVAFIRSIILVFAEIDVNVTVLAPFVGVTDEIKTQLSDVAPPLVGAGTVDDPITKPPRLKCETKLWSRLRHQ
jgi:hypothetical protein